MGLELYRSVLFKHAQEYENGRVSGRELYPHEKPPQVATGHGLNLRIGCFPGRLLLCSSFEGAVKGTPGMQISA